MTCIGIASRYPQWSPQVANQSPCGNQYPVVISAALGQTRHRYESTIDWKCSTSDERSVLTRLYLHRKKNDKALVPVRCVFVWLKNQADFADKRSPVVVLAVHSVDANHTTTRATK